jgi:hypothetical protein
MRLACLLQAVNPAEELAASPARRSTSCECCSFSVRFCCWPMWPCGHWLPRLTGFEKP